MRRLSLIFMLCLFHFSSTVWAQCPGCVIDLPALPEDTIFIEDAPNGEVGVYYETDISFRVPKTTTPVAAVDSTVLPGLTITEIEITSVTNLPPGLSWEASQLQFEVANETDGCVKFCGTPVYSDSFFVEVQLTATVLGIEQSSSFLLPIFIEPASSINDGFAMTGNVGCGTTSVTFTNNVPSNGHPGYSYYWDFGNGNTTTQENPTPQQYDTPGTYPVTFEAVIDTAGYFLTNVTVLDTDCNDFAIPPANKPDLYIQIQNPSGTVVYTSSTQDDVDLPASFDFNLTLSTGNYSILVYDDDLFGDEFCGSVNFNQTTAGTLTDGDLELSIDIVHPLITVNTTDTVTVYPQPAPPLIDPNVATICAGDSIALFTDYTEQLQWYRDSVLLPGATTNPLQVMEAGSYWVTYTNDFGCTATSTAATVGIEPLPFEPVFVNENNLLYLYFPDSLPANYTLQWSANDIPIPGADEQQYCIQEEGTNTYTLEVIDLDTGCSSTYSSEETYDPNVDCFDSTRDLISVAPLKLFPNPVLDFIQLSSPNRWTTGTVTLTILNATGRVFINRKHRHDTGNLSVTVPVEELPAGWYLLQWTSESGRGSIPFIKQ